MHQPNNNYSDDDDSHRDADGPDFNNDADQAIRDEEEERGSEDVNNPNADHLPPELQVPPDPNDALPPWDPELPTPEPGQRDPIRMQLTPQEREWALDIKNLVEGAPDLDNLSDFLYATLALYTQGDHVNAVDRVYRMQEFRQEYDILDSYEEALRYMRQALIDGPYPKMLLSFSFNPEDGNYTVVYDMTKFDIDLLSTNDGFRTAMKTIFYFGQVIRPDLDAHRRGPILLAECGGYEWNRGMWDAHSFRKFAAERFNTYPLQIQTIRQFNTPMLYNLMVSMAKRYMPEPMRDKFVPGCRFVGGMMRLDQLYLVPTPEAASERAHRNLRVATRIRYDNERDFTL